MPKELISLQEIWKLALQSKMPYVLNKYPDRPFQPHMTLVHKDVTPPVFQKMWQYYAPRKYQASFDVGHFCILGHGDKGWKVEQKYYFGE